VVLRVEPYRADRRVPIVEPDALLIVAIVC